MNDVTSLDSYIKRFTNLENERRQHAEIFKDLKLEAKNSGYDAEAIIEVVRRMMADSKRRAITKEKAEMARLYAEKIGQKDLF
jgi:uncharacterized protein (UPF0335 family)